jgi:hypothetical protein
MRFYHPASGRVLEARNPRIRFFLFGPFYLAWLRLWKEALASAAIVWIFVHGTIALTASSLGVSSGPDINAAVELLMTIHSAPMTGASADAAFQQMVAMLMPFLAGGFILLLLASLMALRLPDYLVWRYGRQGFVLLRTDEDELAEIDELELR